MCTCEYLEKIVSHFYAPDPHGGVSYMRVIGKVRSYNAPRACFYNGKIRLVNYGYYDSVPEGPVVSGDGGRSIKASPADVEPGDDILWFSGTSS